MRAIEEIHRLLRLLQGKYRRIRKGSQLPALIETHILVELDAGGKLSVNDLASSLCIDQSQVSRTLQRLRATRLISQQQSSKDARTVLSYLTNTGKKIVDRVDNIFHELYSSSRESLNKQQANQLADFLEGIVYGSGIKIIRRRPHEDRLRAAHRQLARVFGFLRKDVFYSGLTRARWFTLEAIVQASGTINATQLAVLMGIRSSHLSEILTSYEVNDFIERVRSVNNYKALDIRITASGRRYFKQIEKQAVSRLSQILLGYSQNQLSSIHSLLKLFTGELGRKSIYLDQLYQTRQILDKNELKLTRAFCLRELVAKSWELYCPDPLLTHTSEVWGVFEKNDNLDFKPLAICIAQPNRSKWEIILAVSSNNIGESQFNSFIRHAYYQSSYKQRYGEICSSFEPLRLK